MADTATNSPAPAPAIETIDDAAFNTMLDQGVKISQIGAVDATKGLAATLSMALQNKVAAAMPQTAARVKANNDDVMKRNDAVRLERNHALWTALHTRPKSDLWQPGTDDMAFIEDKVSKVPGCARCRNNAAAYIKATPPDFTSRRGYAKWLVGFHNSASADAGHAPWTWEQAVGQWGGPGE